MSIREHQVRDAIVDALDFVTLQWSDAQCDVLDNVANELNPLTTAPSVFQAAAWLNAGIAAVTTLFPASAVAASIGKYAVSLAVTTYAMDRFQDVYRSERERGEALLRGDAQSLKGQLKSEIRKAARNLSGTPFGRSVETALVPLLMWRADYTSAKSDQFDSLGMLRAHCKNLIANNLLSTDENDILQRTRAGFDPLFDKLYEVYHATHTAGSLLGGRSMTLLNPSRFECYLNPYVSGRLPMPQYDPLAGKMAACGPEQHVIWSDGSSPSGGPGGDPAALKKVLANIWNYDLHFVDGWQEQKLYAWPTQKSKTLHEVTAAATSYARNGIGPEVVSVLAKAEKAEWLRTRQLAS